MTQNDLQKLAEKLWNTYCEIFPKLVKFDCPRVEWNNRFTTTGGISYSERRLVQLAGKFFVKYPDEMLQVTLPHELAHQIDYDLNGWKYRAKHHRDSWKIIMVKIGLPPEIYHTMVL